MKQENLIPLPSFVAATSGLSKEDIDSFAALRASAMMASMAAIDTQPLRIISSSPANNASRSPAAGIRIEFNQAMVSLDSLSTAPCPPPGVRFLSNAHINDDGNQKSSGGGGDGGNMNSSESSYSPAQLAPLREARRREDETKLSSGELELLREVCRNRETEEWEWTSPTLMQFTPKQPLAGSSQYTLIVPRGLQSVVGGTLTDDFVLTWTTSPAAIVQSVPLQRSYWNRNTTDTLRPTIFLGFDQRVRIDSVIPRVSLGVKKGPAASSTPVAPVDGVAAPLPMTVASGHLKLLSSVDEVRQKLTPDVIATWLPPVEAKTGDEKKHKGETETTVATASSLPSSCSECEKWIALECVGDLEVETTYCIDVAPGVVSAEGPLLTTATLSREFSTYMRLKVERHDPRSETHRGEFGSGLTIVFSNKLDKNYITKRMLRLVSPWPWPLDLEASTTAPTTTTTEASGSGSRNTGDKKTAVVDLDKLWIVSPQDRYYNPAMTSVTHVSLRVRDRIFPAGTYTVAVSGVRDVYGQVLPDTSLTFHVSSPLVCFGSELRNTGIAGPSACVAICDPNLSGSLSPSSSSSATTTAATKTPSSFSSSIPRHVSIDSLDPYFCATVRNLSEVEVQVFQVDSADYAYYAPILRSTASYLQWDGNTRKEKRSSS